ncbi:hypothetical protein D9M71_654390 [compost metagenome]
MNLTLEKDGNVEWEFLYQTPTKVTKAALASDDPVKYYKDWVLECRDGIFEDCTKEHFQLLDEYVAEGYKFIMI